MSAKRRALWEQGEQHIRKVDATLVAVMDRAGPFSLSLPKNRFWTLVASIVSQQLSTSAARTIRRRLEESLDGDLTAAAILSRTHEQLRGVGLSNQKTSFILDLAQKTADGELQFSKIGRHSDEAIIAELTQVRGIGRWTAQMFLIFALGRLDVFPYDDLGVRAAIRNLYGLEDLPTKAEAAAISSPWRPYSSIASWYCWRSLEQPAQI